MYQLITHKQHNYQLIVYQLTIFNLIILEYLNYLHQQSLSKCLTFKHVSVVFNYFTLLLIHGLSRGIVLTQQEKTPQKILWDESRFMEDSRMLLHVWVIDIVFLMDRTQELSNLKLQAPGHHIYNHHHVNNRGKHGMTPSLTLMSPRSGIRVKSWLTLWLQQSTLLKTQTYWWREAAISAIHI